MCEFVQVADFGQDGGLVAVCLDLASDISGKSIGAEKAAHLEIAIEAQNHCEPGHRWLADTGKLRQFHARQEAKLRTVLDHALGDAPLCRSQPLAGRATIQLSPQRVAVIRCG